MVSMRTLRRLGLVAVIAVGVGMVGSSVAGVAAIDAKLETAPPRAVPVKTEEVVLEKRCPERHKQLLEQQRRREQRTSFST